MEIFLLIIALQIFSFIFYWELHKRLGEVELRVKLMWFKKDVLKNKKEDSSNENINN